jgi:tetratricopeptide (TPR) repeat protein
VKPKQDQITTIKPGAADKSDRDEKDDDDAATPAELRKRWLNSRQGQRAIDRLATHNKRKASDSKAEERADAAGRAIADVTAKTAGIVASIATFGAVDSSLLEGSSDSNYSAHTYDDYDYYDNEYHHDNPYWWVCNWSNSFGWSQPCNNWGFYGGWPYCWSYGFNWYWNRCAWSYPYYGWRSSRYGIRYPLAHSYATVIYTTSLQEEEPIQEESYDEPVDDSRVMEGEGAAATDSHLGQRLNRAADYYLVLGDRAFLEGRYGATVHYYAKAIEFSPDQGMLYLLLSDALFATGDYAYCASVLRKALQLEPGLATNVIDKHELYTNPTDFDEQLVRLETYVTDHPLDEDARLVLAVNYLFSGNPQLAVNFLESATSHMTRADAVGALLLRTAKEVVQE